jgi:hypothetical protein
MHAAFWYYILLPSHTNQHAGTIRYGSSATFATGGYIIKIIAI